MFTQEQIEQEAAQWSALRISAEYIPESVAQGRSCFREHGLPVASTVLILTGPAPITRRPDFVLKPKPGRSTCAHRV